jgi:iron complex outermembrane receptor protein
VRAGFGDDNLLDGFIALDAPFTETFKSRFTFGIRQQDGYVERVVDGTDLGDTNTYTAMAKFVWTPSEAFTGKLLMDYTTADENGSPLVFRSYTETAAFGRVASLDAGCPGLTDGAVPPPTMADQPVPMIQDDRCSNDLQSRGPYANNGTAPLTSQLDNYGASLNLLFTLSKATDLKSISSYRDIQWEGNRDADNTPLPILHTFYDVDGSQWSQEFQLLYQSSPLTGVFGVYYFEQESDDIVTITLNPPVTPPPPGPNMDSDNNKVENTSWAVFTQWTYRFSEALGVTLGGRYTEDEKGSYPDQFDFSNPAAKTVPVQWYRDTFTKFTPSASVDYRFSEQAMMYASYSEGFKGGGWNSHFNLPPPTVQELAAVQEFQPEEAKTYEIGFKLDLAGNTLRLNGAVFTTDYDDLQVTYRGPVRPPPAMSGVAPFLVNAGKASVDGAELEATWLPTANWIVEASIGYLDATLDELDINPLASPPASLQEGNVLPFAPEWQAHLGIGFDIHAGNFLITPRVDASYQDRTYFDAGNTPDIAQLDSVETVNASIRLGPDQGTWYLTLGVNNATDEVYPIAGNSSLDTGSGYAEIAYSRPREYFAIFNYDF